jgi:hypothetical protein
LVAHPDTNNAQSSAQNRSTIPIFSTGIVSDHRTYKIVISLPITSAGDKRGSTFYAGSLNFAISISHREDDGIDAAGVAKDSRLQALVEVGGKRS